MSIREVTAEDFPEWLRLREALYPECSSHQLKAELESIYFNRTVAGELDYSVWVAERSPGKLFGFIEVSLRAEVPRCDTAPVGYVESLFVDEDCRRCGTGSRLLSKGQQWVMQRNCRACCVDTDPAAADAMVFYQGFGFQEIYRDTSAVLYMQSVRQ